MDWLDGLVILGVIGLSLLLYKQTKKETARHKKDLEIQQGVIDVRRNAENAKHDNPDAIKRVQDKYNS